MTDELLNDAEINNDHIEEATETDESGAELATATEGQQDKPTDGAQKAINKQHAKFREQERRADALDKELADANDRLKAIESETKDVTVPELPDYYEDDFEEKLKARDNAIMRKAQEDAKQQSIIDQQSAQTEATAKIEKERVNVLIGGYTQRISTLGLSSDEIRIAGDTVVNNGIDGQVAEYILGDEDGPLITKYLAANPIVQDELRGLTTIQAAMKINSDIRTAASTLKPQASGAPDPAETLSGRGAGEQVSPFIKGATFT